MDKRNQDLSEDPNAESDHKIVDKDGKTICVARIGKRYFLPGAPKNFGDVIKSFDARDDDVYVAGYPRSGTHWVFDITQMLITNTTEVPKHLYSNTCMELRSFTPSVFDSLPSPRLTNSHRLPSELPLDAFRRRCKIVYVERFFKDVAISLYYFTIGLTIFQYTGEWSAFCDLFRKGDVPFSSWFDYVKSWRRFIRENPDYPVYRTTYERLTENPSEEINRLSEFLGVKLNPELLVGILGKTEFSRMKAVKDNDYKERFPASVFVGGKANIYRKGIMGDWKNYFTVAQSEMYDEEYKKQMKQESQEIAGTEP